MESKFPRFVVFKNITTKKYMRCVNETLSYSGDSALDPRAKFEFEKSKTVGGYFHIRCCYNNKYWTRDSANYGAKVVAASHEPKEKGWDSTLFNVGCFSSNTDTDTEITIQNLHIRHVGNGDLVCATRPQDGVPPDDGYLYGVRNGDPLLVKGDPIFRITNRDSFLTLPKLVSFKGANGCYLQAVKMDDGHVYLQFSAKDSRNQASHHEVDTDGDGCIYIKSKSCGLFWSIGRWWNYPTERWIWAEKTQATSSVSRFWPVKIGHNQIVIRSISNGKYCSRLTDQGKTSCLNADTREVRWESMLTVEEPIRTSKISNVRYRLNDVRKYGEQVVQSMSLEDVNQTSREQSTTLKFSYRKTTTQMLSSSASLKLGVKTEVKAGFPFLAEGKIEVSAEVEGSRQWGETTEISQECGFDHQVTTPPNKKVIAWMTVTQGRYDVPFSYTQSDTLFDGRQVIREMDDGMYEGSNTATVRVLDQEFPI